MQSLTERIHAEVLQIELLLNQLMQYSDIVRWNYSAIKLSGMSDYKWTELSEEGKKLQDQAITAYRRFISFVRCLRSDLSAADGHALEAATQKVLSIIEQTNYLNSMDKEAQFLTAAKLIDKQRRLLFTLYRISDDCSIVVPDPVLLTDAVNPEEWQLKEIDKFKIVRLSPATLSQVSGISILPWLDLANQQDRTIIACLEIAKKNPRSQVVLATNDSVLQIKAAAANLPCINAPVIKPAHPAVMEKFPAPMPAPPAAKLPEEPSAAKTRSSSKSEAARNRQSTRQTTAVKPNPSVSRAAATGPIIIPTAIRPEMLNPAGLQPPAPPNKNRTVIAKPKVSGVNLDFTKIAPKGAASARSTKPASSQPNRQ